MNIFIKKFVLKTLSSTIPSRLTLKCHMCPSVSDKFRTRVSPRWIDWTGIALFWEIITYVWGKMSTECFLLSPVYVSKNILTLRLQKNSVLKLKYECIQQQLKSISFQSIFKKIKFLFFTTLKLKLRVYNQIFKFHPIQLDVMFFLLVQLEGSKRE